MKGIKAKVGEAIDFKDGSIPIRIPEKLVTLAPPDEAGIRWIGVKNHVCLNGEYYPIEEYEEIKKYHKKREKQDELPES